MGVPKFYRWLSERYPKIMQRRGVRPNPELSKQHLDRIGPWLISEDDGPILEPTSFPLPDPLSEAGLAPEIDRLYIDMNGIIHGCSHNNISAADDLIDSSNEISVDEICDNVCYYLHRIVTEVAQPKELMYLAIDGVAPRAKLNQQRARRYRSGKEGEIEQTVYDAHVQAIEREKQRRKEASESENTDKEGFQSGGAAQLPIEDYEILLDDSEMDPIGSLCSRSRNRVDQHENSSLISSGLVTELEDGRFTGKFETTIEPFSTEADDNDTEHNGKKFHSNSITPGTLFFQKCTERILDLIEEKMRNDPDWRKLTIIFSGPNVPGEGEHKIMQFIREQRVQPDYNPNLRHCIMGQDGDLIMLGLATHEPNLMLLREQVLFDKRGTERDKLAETYGLDLYLFNANFEFLHMNVLRDYLAFELETVLPDSPFDLERSIDDFVFMTFLVGNDFLPHMPALDIADEAFDLLFYTYRALRKQWVKQSPNNPYLTHAGDIVSGKRLEEFLRAIGAHEGKYYDYKESITDLGRTRAREIKYGQPKTPSDEVLQYKEASDRRRYREMLEASAIDLETNPSFTPVLSSATAMKGDTSDEAEHERQVKDLHKLLKLSLSDAATGTNLIDDKDLKGRYYADKFNFSPFDADKHIALRRAYIEGLVWNLKYYYQGCVSWEWYYPYHYGPFMSDLVGIDDLLSDISFESKLGAPLKPFEQLLACLPPSHAHLLPKPYRHLMRTKNSPIADFYPSSFVIDMNGKRLPWEAVVLLPFIDSQRLIAAAHTVQKELLTEDEQERNTFSDTMVLSNVEGSTDSLSIVPIAASKWRHNDNEKVPVLEPKLLSGTEVPLAGLPTLRDGLITGLWRKYIPLNVHGARSRYKIACLEMQNAIPEIIPLDVVARQVIGTAVVINYPHFIEGLVTAVSDSSGLIRGHNGLKPWTAQELAVRRSRVRHVVSSYVIGETLVGTGGVAIASGSTGMEDLDVLLFVRPLKELKQLRNGTVGKVYSKFEVEVPLFVTSWAPMKPDPRLVNVPALLEKNPYEASEVVLTQLRSTRTRTIESSSNDSRSLSGGKTSPHRSIATRSVHTVTEKIFSPLSTQAPRTLSPLMRSTLALNRRITTQAIGVTYVHDGRIRRHSLLRANAAPKTKLMATGFVLAGLLFSCVSSITARDLWSGRNGIPKATDQYNYLSQDSFLSQAAQSYKPHDSAPPLLFEHGTTTLSFVFEKGIIVAVDSRASLGSFVGSKTVQKVLPIHSHMLGTMAGGAADCSFWIRKLKAQAKLYELQNEGEKLSVTQASRMLANSLYDNRGLGLSVGTMMAGYDGNKAVIYFVDNSGMRIDGNLFSVGSGSTYALGILDTEYHWDLSIDDAVRLGIKAIRHATFRDAGSGGWIHVYLITKDEGLKHVFAQDLAGLSVTDASEVSAAHTS